MRIVHVVRQYAPSVGGLEAVVQRLATEQRSRLGHDVTVVTLDRLFADPHTRLPARETIDGIEVRRLAWAGSSRYPLCPQVVAHLDGADLVHVHAIDFFFDWLSLTRFVHRKPMIASTHGGFFHTAFASTLKKLWFDTITRFSSLGYRRIVATSDNDGAVFARVAGSRVVVVENGAEVARFRDAASASVVPTLLYFGRWSTNKGLLELLALMAELHRRDPAWRLIVAGRAFDLTRATLQAQIDALDLTGAVELHAATVGRRAAGADDAGQLLRLPVAARGFRHRGDRGDERGPGPDPERHPAVRASWSANRPAASSCRRRPSPPAASTCSPRRPRSSDCIERSPSHR